MQTFGCRAFAENDCLGVVKRETLQDIGGDNKGSVRQEELKLVSPLEED